MYNNDVCVSLSVKLFEIKKNVNILSSLKVTIFFRRVNYCMKCKNNDSNDSIVYIFNYNVYVGERQLFIFNCI